ncbi:MAG: hypothetical protein U9M90_01420 [Patescibacteria group bacterium]|nr:hypothetical protein [Patescibacteria group bacterium]
MMLAVLFFSIITAFSANAENAGKKCRLVIGSSSREYKERIPVLSCTKNLSDYSFSFLKSLLLKADTPNYVSVEHENGTFSEETVILHN